MSIFKGFFFINIKINCEYQKLYLTSEFQKTIAKIC